MDYILKPSLKHRTLTNTAISLWTQGDIKSSMARFSVFENERQWKHIESQVTASIAKLPLPKSLKKDIECFIKPIGLQIFNWITYHVGNGYLDVNSLPEFCWTQHGIIDKKRTAKLLVMNDHLDITERYKLACVYCFEDDIRMLWNKMSAEHKKAFYVEEDPLQVDQQEIVVFWTYLIKEEMAKLGKVINGYTSYEHTFIWALVRGNEAAIEYFLQKLAPEEGKKHLIQAARCAAILRFSSDDANTNFPKDCYSNILCFLLTQMDPQQQLMAIKVCHYGALKCFLDWPWQDFFMKTAHYVWEFHSQDVCICLYEDIVRKIADGYKDYDYQWLLREFWLQSPATHKRHIIQESVKRKTFLSVLSELKDEETISLILKDASLTEKESVLFLQGKSI